MKFLILGASGLVGGNCQKFFAEKGHDGLGTHFSFEIENTQFFNTLDLGDLKNVNLDEFNQDVIVHCGDLSWCIPTRDIRHHFFPHHLANNYGHLVLF